MDYSKYEIDNFDNTGDYGRWKQKMWSLLVQQEVPEGVTNVWKKLDELYLLKSLSSRISLKVQLFGFRIDTSKSLESNLNELKQMIIELVDSGEDLSNEN